MMNLNNQYNTLSEAIRQLKKRGYTLDFQMNEQGKLEEIDGEACFSVDEVELGEFHRFEGMSNPSDSSIVYALETKSGLKGTIVDAYGAKGSKMISNFINKNN